MFKVIKKADILLLAVFLIFGAVISLSPSLFGPGHSSTEASTESTTESDAAVAENNTAAADTASAADSSGSTVDASESASSETEDASDAGSSSKVAYTSDNGAETVPDDYDGATVLITVRGQEYGRYALDKDQDIDIIQDPGIGDPEENVISIKDGGVTMDYSNCKNQVCVEEGTIKDSASSIVCLPHSLMIEIQGIENIDGMDAVSK